MKTVIYTFSGTGNSLAAAKTIASALGDCELVPIALLKENAITPMADRVGIVCPVYFAGLPLAVASFADRLDVSKARYVFAIVTHGGGWRVRGVAPARQPAPEAGPEPRCRLRGEHARQLHPDVQFPGRKNPG